MPTTESDLDRLAEIAVRAREYSREVCPTFMGNSRVSIHDPLSPSRRHDSFHVWLCQAAAVRHLEDVLFPAAEAGEDFSQSARFCAHLFRFWAAISPEGRTAVDFLLAFC